MSFVLGGLLAGFGQAGTKIIEQQVEDEREAAKRAWEMQLAKTKFGYEKSLQNDRIRADNDRVGMQAGATAVENERSRRAEAKLQSARDAAAMARQKASDAAAGERNAVTARSDSPYAKGLRNAYDGTVRELTELYKRMQDSTGEVNPMVQERIEDLLLQQTELLREMREVDPTGAPSAASRSSGTPSGTGGESPRGVVNRALGRGTDKGAASGPSGSTPAPAPSRDTPAPQPTPRTPTGDTVGSRISAAAGNAGGLLGDAAMSVGSAVGNAVGEVGAGVGQNVKRIGGNMVSAGKEIAGAVSGEMDATGRAIRDNFGYQPRVENPQQVFDQALTAMQTSNDPEAIKQFAKAIKIMATQDPSFRRRLTERQQEIFDSLTRHYGF